MSFLDWLFGKRKEESTSIESIHEINPTNKNQENYYGVDGFTARATVLRSTWFDSKESPHTNIN